MGFRLETKRDYGEFLLIAVIGVIIVTIIALSDFFKPFIETHILNKSSQTSATIKYVSGPIVRNGVRSG